MKKYILISIIFLFFGCNNSKKESFETEKLNEISILTEEKISNSSSKITIEPIIQEYTCWGRRSNIMNDIYVSYISNNISECNFGKAKIILEKVIDRTNDGKAIFVKLDEINVEIRNENETFSKIYLKISPETKEQDYIIKFYDDRKEIITKVYDIWKVDLEIMKFRKIDIPENLKFDNPDWME